MAKITQKGIYQNGEQSDGKQLNDDISQIVSTVNALDTDNIKDGVITRTKLSFFVSTAMKNSLASESVLLANAIDPANAGQIVFCMAENSLWGYDAFGQPVKLAGNVPVTSHNFLAGRDLADAHPQSAITGLTDRLTAIELKNSQQDTSIGTNGTDINSIKAKNSQQDTDIGNLNTRLNSVEGTQTVQSGSITSLTTQLTAKRDKTDTTFGDLYLKNSGIWSGDPGHVYSNSNTSSDNYGIVLSTGRLKDNSQGSRLDVGNATGRTMLFFPTEGGNAYEVYHAGNLTYANFHRKDATLSGQVNVPINTDWLITDGTTPWTYTVAESGLYSIEVTPILITVAGQWVATSTMDVSIWLGTIGTAGRQYAALEIGSLAAGVQTHRSKTLTVYLAQGTVVNVTCRHNSAGTNPLQLRGFSVASHFTVQQLTRA